MTKEALDRLIPNDSLLISSVKLLIWFVPITIFVLVMSVPKLGRFILKGYFRTTGLDLFKKNEPNDFDKYGIFFVDK